MNDIQYNIQFESLCNILQLGMMISAPKPLSGGLLHRMYCLETTKGKYAIKALNPKIMLRPTAMLRYIKSEQIADIAANNIPALPAKKFNGEFIHKIDNQFYIVFNWVDGISLKPYEINTSHCEKIGSILADIHGTDFSELDVAYEYVDNEPLIDWNYYLQKGKESNAAWVKLLHENIDMLYSWNAQTNKSEKLLASDMVISHRDLDPKNVLWNENNPLIIDWESAGCINPMQDLTETAFYWSEDEVGNINKERFMAFVSGYKKSRGMLNANWRAILSSGFSGRLGWLEYNLKRSLMIECTDEEEQQMGTTQVIETVSAIKRYADVISEIENWLIVI